MASATKEFILEVQDTVVSPPFLLTEDLARSISTEEPVPLEIELDSNVQLHLGDDTAMGVTQGSGTYQAVVTDCPASPNTLAAITLGGNPTWSALDPVTHKICVLDDSSSNIYFIDAATNTLLATVDLGGGSGAPSIIMDTLNNQFVIMNYSGDIIFVDPVAQAEITRISGLIAHRSSNMLAYDPITGHTFATSYRDVNVTTGKMRVIDGATHTVLSSTTNVVGPDGITWCPNIGKVYITYVGIGQPLYRLFDPISLTFTSSAQVHSTNFNYECFWNPILGVVMQSRDGSSSCLLVDVMADTSNPFSSTITRITAAGFDTCNNETWLSDGNTQIYVMTGAITTKKIYSCKPTGLLFDKHYNLMYFVDYGTTQAITLPAAGPNYPADESDEMGYASFGNLGGITSITFNNVISIPGFDIETNTELLSLHFPFLVYIDPNNLQGGYIFIDSDPNIVTVDMPVFMPTPGGSYSITNCGLNAASVNGFLHRCVANPNFTTGSVDLSGGTNSAPTGAGIADKATLIGRGVTVTTN